MLLSRPCARKRREIGNSSAAKRRKRYIVLLSVRPSPNFSTIQDNGNSSWDICLSLCLFPFGQWYSTTIMVRYCTIKDYTRFIFPKLIHIKFYSRDFKIVVYISVYEPLPESLSKESQKAQLRRMLELRVNPIDGLSSKWDYDNDRWKVDYFYFALDPSRKLRNRHQRSHG